MDRLTGLKIQNGLDFTGAINNYNNVTWLAGIQLRNLKQIPEELKDIPKDIQKELNQITTNFCNLFSNKENLERASKIVQNANSEELTNIINEDGFGLVSGNVTDVLIRSNCWTVGGIVFDGVLQCEHTSESKPTDYLVQGGAVMSDHMINQPVTVSMSIIMSDITPEQLEPINEANAITTLQEVSKQLEDSKNISNWINFKGAKRRSEYIYKVLKGIQLANYPLEITTRLYNYKNMVITGLSAVENAESFNGLVCNIQFREIMMAGVSEKVICKRVLDETKPMQAGNITASEITNGKTFFAYLGINKNTPSIQGLRNFFRGKGTI